MLKFVSRLLLAAVVVISPMTAHAAADPALAKRTELAVQVVKAEGTEEQTRIGLQKILPLMMSMIKSQDAFKDYSDSEIQKLSDLIGTELNNAIPELTQKYAAFYANKLTDAQLNSVLAFYATTEGKTYAATRVTAASELQSEFEGIGQKAALNAMQKFLEWKSKQPK
ncbi:DUF2059 domain-containing protein [Asticcacaulis machinosus]|uniref:DUF2059 domain-containing protein n=1 Tax=Asticcacaulis machinosus TaxID=2984211 RepID=A0ABT5HID0_9CAUL|nr:DUF2059 domain-containing protein [Asticcacaulis machinosus]MDC7676006.1 DUF2059 domain-containing protein [Asticcacaulis machinosus]